ncbi:MAG: restriction endonuclease subunit S, partial [Elusimicrobiota bacterium]
MIIPKGWIVVEYNDLIKKISIINRKIKQKNYLPSGLYPIIDQGKTFIGGYTNDQNKLLSCQMPVIVFGDHTKIVKFVDINFAPGADGVKIIKPFEFFIPKLFFYFTKYLSKKIPDKGYSRHFQYLLKEKIPLPPLNEQNRIVEKIEELFSGLDKATEELEKVRKQLKIYRQSVLKAAFDGKLTDNESYDYLSFSKICDINPPKKEISNTNGELEVTFLPMSLLTA